MDPEALQLVINIAALAIAGVALGTLIATGKLRERTLAAGPTRDAGFSRGVYAVAAALVCLYAGLMIALGGLRQPSTLFVLQLTPFVLVGLMLGRLMNTPGGFATLGIVPDKPGRDVVWAAIAGVVGLALVGAAGIALTYLFNALGDPPPQIVHETLQKLRSEYSAELLVGIIISAVVLAPLFEELIFRGMLQTSVLHLLGHKRWPALLITAGVFALTHWWAVSYHGLIPLFIIGLVFGYVYERTGSILAAVLTHAMFNAMNIAITLAVPLEQAAM